MYRLRQMDVDDKVCDQVDMTLLAQVYPTEAIERGVGQSEPWASKARRRVQRAGRAGGVAGVLRGGGGAAEDAKCLLWSLWAHGHRWDGLQHRRHGGQ